jgi:hypothetical protein
MATPQANGFESALADALGALGNRFRVEMRGARRELGDRLNQALRRLRQSEGESDWSVALVDSAESFSSRCALFAVEDGSLRLLAARGIDPSASAQPVPLDHAAAFSSAVESREPVVALWDVRELSEPLAHLFSDPQPPKFHLFPIVAGERVAAILYADSPSVDFDANLLELLAAAGGASLDSARLRWNKRASLVNLPQVPPPPVSKARKAWEELTTEDQRLHLRAQRSARVSAARIRLYSEEAVQQGRRDGHLYLALKDQIDKDRENFQKEFLDVNKSMVDYLHLELVRTIANDNAALLGPEYPGPAI